MHIPLEDVLVLFICGAFSKDKQELQSPGENAKEGHSCYTGFGNPRRREDGCHDNAVQVGDMVEDNDGPQLFCLNNILSALDPHVKEVQP